LAQKALPLEAARSAADQGWLIRLPVRAEQVRVSKDVIVRERVVIRRQVVTDVARAQAGVSREWLRVGPQGGVAIADADRNPT
jgi:uncharacterized protein (TIGR02271 family)